MAVTKIEYSNKVALEDDPSVAEINKVTDNNMNEIKSVVNNNADVLETAEVTTNKVTSISSASTDTQYPSAKCVYDLIGDIGEALDIINGEEIN